MKFNYRFSNLCGSVYTGGNTVFTPDGRSVISPVSNRVTVFDLVNHRTSTLAFSLTSTVNCLTLSPDGRLLIAIADDGRAIAYHFEHGTVLFDFNLGGRCEVAKFSLDGRYVAFALDRRIEVYHSPPLIASHRPMQKHLSFHSHHETVRCLEWSSSSNNQSVYLLSGSDDGTARIHSVGADEGDQSFVPLSLTGHRGAVVGAFWGGECSETDNQSISVYTVSSDGQFLHWRWQPRDEDEEPAGKPVNKKSITKVLASRSQTSLSLFGIPGRFSLSTKHFFNANTGGSTVTCATLHSSPQSVNNSIDLLIVAFSTGVFSLYEVPSFTLIHSLSVSASPLSSVSVSPDGAWLSLGSSALGSLCVWEWQSESYLLKQQGHSALITCLAYSSDGQFVVTGGEDGRVKLWNAATGFCFKTFSDHTAPVTSVAVSEVGAVVVSCSLDGTAHAYDLTRYRLFRTLKPEFPVQYTHMCLDPSGELVICVSNDPFELHVYSLETGKLIDSLGGHTAPISAISYSSSLSLLFTSSWDKTVKVWDVFNGRGCVDTFSHAHEVLSVAVSPRGDQLVSATLNGDLSIWSISEASIIGTIEARRDLQHGRLRDQARSSKTSAHSSYVTSMCYSADGSSLLTGGNTRYVCIYDMASRLLLNKFTVATSERLDGGKDKLNSRYMEANLAGTSMDNERDNSLPGVRTGERSDRKFTQSVRTRCVRFAPSGSQWACATPEGLLIYALDQDATFDPIDLGLDTTPAAVEQALSKEEFARALLLALRLNESDLIGRALDAIPPSSLPLIMQGVPSNRVERLLSVLSAQLEKTPDFEFHLTAIRAVLVAHQSTIRSNLATFSTILRRITRVFHRVRQEIGSVCEENRYLLEYLCNAREDPEAKPVADQLLLQQSLDQLEDMIEDHIGADDQSNTQSNTSVKVETSAEDRPSKRSKRAKK